MNSEYEQYKMDGLHEECGVFGMYDLDGGDVASSIYYGLFSLQHRGQESCGIAVSDTNGPKRKVDVQKGMGLVNEVFDEENLSKLKGNIGVGHVRYSTAGASNRMCSRLCSTMSKGHLCLLTMETWSMRINCAKRWNIPAIFSTQRSILKSSRI